MSLEAPSPYTLARIPRALQASRSSASLRASSPSALIARSSSCGQVTCDVQTMHLFLVVQITCRSINNMQHTSCMSR